jgi:cytochrome c biogenesis protein CcdA
VLELACTGQVYLPTIQYMLRSGRSGAAWPLFLYNCAFIVPLVIVFLLAFTGMRSETLVEWQKENITIVKVLTGLLFLGLTLLLLFSYRPLGGS